MTPTTQYRADDGTIFRTEGEALARDLLHNVVSKLEAALPPIPKNSDQRVAVDKEVRDKVKAQVVALCRMTWPNEQVFQKDPLDIMPMSYAGRFIDDACYGRNHPIRRIWYWFMCEKDGWLYQQPYYALNPAVWEREYGAK